MMTWQNLRPHARAFYSSEALSHSSPDQLSVVLVVSVQLRVQTRLLVGLVTCDCNIVPHINVGNSIGNSTYCWLEEGSCPRPPLEEGGFIIGQGELSSPPLEEGCCRPLPLDKRSCPRPPLKEGSCPWPWWPPFSYAKNLASDWRPWLSMQYLLNCSHYLLLNVPLRFLPNKTILSDLLSLFWWDFET